MSALDDVIAQGMAMGNGQSMLDQLIAREAAMPPQSGGAPPQTMPQGMGGQVPDSAQDLANGGASPNTWGDLKQIGSGAWHGVSSLVNNAANLVEKGAAAGANAIPGVRGSAVGNWLANTANNDVSAQSAADQQFQQTASPGAQAASFVAPMVIPISGVMKGADAVKAGVQALPMMGGAAGALVGSLAGNGLAGAGLSAGAPVDPNQAYWPQVAKNMALGASIGTALPAAAGAAKGVANNLLDAARPILNPRDYVGQQFAAQIGDNAGQVAGNIRSAPAFVPGSTPTTAQAGQHPVLVATEKALANSDPNFKLALATQEAQNNGARWNALSDVAQTPLDLANAQATRDAAVQPLYNTAKQQQFPVDAPLSNILNRPLMQAAVARAQQLADNQSAGPIISTVRIPNSMGGAPTTSTTMTGTGAHYVKMALDDMLNPQSQSGFVGNSQNALKDTRAAFMSWLESNSPEYSQARQTYAAGSVPVNTMEAGQQMVDKLSGRNLNTFGAPQLTSQSYQTALAQALKKQQFGIDPQAESTLNNIASDLQRSTVSNGLGTPGSDTAYNASANGWLARQLYGEQFGGTTGLGKSIGALGAAVTGHPIVGLGILGGGNKLGLAVRDRLNAQLSDLLLNPQSALPYLDAQSAGGGKAAALAQALMRSAGPLAAYGASQAALPAPTR